MNVIGPLVEIPVFRSTPVGAPVAPVFQVDDLGDISEEPNTIDGSDSTDDGGENESKKAKSEKIIVLC